MKRLVLFSLLALSFILAGCTQSDLPPGFDGNHPDGWVPPYAQDMNFYSDMPNFDPDAVCPYECCNYSDERYYGKDCTVHGAECVEHVCVKEETPEEPIEKFSFEDNEVFPNVFLTVIDSYETGTALNEYNGYPQFGPIGIYKLGPNEDGESFDFIQGEKVVFVEIRIENKGDSGYLRSGSNYFEELHFFLTNNSGVEILESGPPPRNYPADYEYYADSPVVQGGETVNYYLAFRVPVGYSYTSMVMVRNVEEGYYYGVEKYYNAMDKNIVFPIQMNPLN